MRMTIKDLKKNSKNWTPTPTTLHTQAEFSMASDDILLFM